QCLQCHATDYRVAEDRSRPESTDRGIGCERCHGPGGNHVRAVATKFRDPAIARPQLYSADRIIALCGQCHSPREDRSADLDKPAAVKFQAATLIRSRCYTESDGSFQCLTCHNPHRNAETSPS